VKAGREWFGLGFSAGGMTDATLPWEGDSEFEPKHLCANCHRTGEQCPYGSVIPDDRFDDYWRSLLPGCVRAKTVSVAATVATGERQ
jgi:hypothetical protein